MKKLVAMSVAAAFLAGTAGAGTLVEVAPEPPVYTPPPAPAAVNWTGAYVGAQAGYLTNRYTGWADQSGFMGSVFAGYRHDSGSHTWGVEAEIAPATLFGATTTWGDDVNYAAGVYLTAGIPVSEDRRTLLSFQAGPSLVLWDAGDGVTGNSLGLALTAGVEHMVTDSVILRGGLSYGYTPNLGSEGVTTNSYGVGAGVAFRF